jgi:CPA2 family monovalent cation:H+ antiporter-2
LETPRAVVIGYGPIGQTVVRLLRENEIDLTIVELNIETVKALHTTGIRAVYGDATRADTLAGAGVKNADVLVISVPHTGGSSEIVRQAKILNPRIRIIARTGYLGEINDLHDAGADAVFSDEGEVALSMTEYILRINGATPDQIDRERDRVHSDLFFKKRMTLSDED